MSLLYWIPFEKNTINYGLEDIFINTNDLIQVSDGKIGKVYQFNGKSSYCYFNNTITSISDFSICCWIKLNDGFDANAGMHLISFGDNSLRICLSKDGNFIRIISNNAKTCGGFLSSTNAIKDTWYHLTLVFSKGKCSFYLNGNLVKTDSLTYPYPIDVSNKKNIFIGCCTLNSEVGNGVINDWRFYDEALSPKQIKLISQAMICHYPLGEIDGKIGGRNLALSTSSDYSNPYSNFNGSGNICPYLAEVLTKGLSVGDIMTIRLVYKYTDIVAVSGKTAKCFIQASGDVTKWNEGAFSFSGQSMILSGSGEHEIKLSLRINANHLKNNYWSVTIRHDWIQSGSVQWKMFKVEKGSIATPWTPAPEDDSVMYDNIIYDTSGYGNNGSVSGTIAWDNDSPRYKGAYDFNGTGYIYNDNFNLTTTAFTISFWIKIPSTITHQHFDFATFNSWGNEGIGIYWDASGQKTSSGSVFGKDANGDKIHVAVQCRGKLNEWTHFAITWDGTKVYRYSNGIKFSESDFNAGSVYHPRLWLGNSTFGDRTLENSESCMSDFRFYATALSDSDILELYQSSASVDNNGNLMLAGEVMEE